MISGALGRIAGEANLNVTLVIVDPDGSGPGRPPHEQTFKATAIRKVMRPASHRRTSPIPILSA